MQQWRKEDERRRKKRRGKAKRKVQSIEKSTPMERVISQSFMKINFVQLSACQIEIEIEILTTPSDFTGCPMRNLVMSRDWTKSFCITPT